jgi:ribosome recycling factor
MSETILLDVRIRMEKTLEALRNDLITIRTGRASPALIEHLHVEYYGVTTPLNQVAGIAVPEPRMLVVQPWDKTALGPIEKAILKSELGLNPTNDGKVIRIVIPYLSEERRRELIKLVHRKVEEGHVSVRNLRRDGLESLEKLEKAKEVSEDEFKRAKEKLQKLTDAYIERVNEIGQLKEQEILEV